MNTKTTRLNLNWPSLIVLVRHGESEGNKYGRRHMAQVMKKPSYKFALTPLGERQARETSAYLEKRFGLDSFDAYLTSTYTRAQQTFETIFRGKRKNGEEITPLIDARINEITRGYASLVSDEELFTMHPQEVKTLALNGWFHNIPLCGQSCVQVEHIIHSFLAYLREGCGGKRVIIVGHGTWINLCCRVLINRSVAEAERLHTSGFYHNCGVTVFERTSEGGIELTEENIKVWKEPEMTV